MKTDPFQELPEPVNLVVNAIHQLMFSIDWKQDTFLYLSPAYASIWDTPLQEAPAPSSWLRSFHPEDIPQVTDFFETLHAGTREQLECRIITATRTQKWVRIVAIIPAGTSVVTAGTIEDISSQQEHRATLQHFTDRKNTVLQLLSHDLLGPLGNIELSAKLLAEESNADDGSAAALLKIISQNCTRSVLLIQNLVNDEFLTTSKSDLIKQRVEMVGKLQIIVAEFAGSPNVTTQKLEFICDARNCYINIDESKFTQVIINLLSNALKFTPAGGAIRVFLEEKDGAMLISVQDEGIGIPADLLPFVFERFTRARRPGLKGEPTIGLGLSLIKRIVEWHQGSIWIESEEGKGTSVFISLPIMGSGTGQS